MRGNNLATVIADHEVGRRGRGEVSSTLLTLGRTHGDLGSELLAPFGADESGTRLQLDAGRYEPIEPLGSGGMGVVERVWDRDLMRNLALKRLHPERANDGLALRQFLWEARITAYLDHPHIVPVHDLGLDGDGELFFTMKFVRGISLERLIEALRRADAVDRSRELAPADAAIASEHGSENRRLRLFLDLCQAIAYAHERGVLHRDLKPANVMIGEFGEVLIMDWGLAQPLDGPAGKPLLELLPAALRARQARHPSGTPRYMSPEQVLGEPLDERSDLYALGVLLYELMTLRSPYSATDLTGVLMQVAEGDVIPASVVNPDLSPSLAAIIGEAMASDPARRYPSVRALMEDIEAVLDGLTPRAEQASLATRFQRYYMVEGTPHAAHLRLMDLDLALATGVLVGLTTASVVAVWQGLLGATVPAVLAGLTLLVGYTPTRAVFRAMRSGVRTLDRLRADQR